MSRCLLACLDGFEAKSDEKRSGRRCERRAQNVALETERVRHGGNFPRWRTWAAGFWSEKNRVSRIAPRMVKVFFLAGRATAVGGTAMILASEAVAISLEAGEIWSSDAFGGAVIWHVYLFEVNTPLRETLVFLCSCLRPYPCMLGFANVVDLLSEHRCLHKEVECDLFEAEIDSHDSCPTEVVDCVPRVDMSLRQEDGYSRTCSRKRVSITNPTELLYLRGVGGTGSRMRKS